MKLTESEKVFWEKYLGSKLSVNIPSNYVVESSPAGNFDITNKLIELYIAGKKSAGSSIVEDFEVTSDPLPKIGNYWIVLDSEKQPRLILKTIKTEIHKFINVPEYVAIAEGEGDLSLEYWKLTHAKFYEPYLTSWNIKHIDDAHVITEFFEIVWK